MTRNDGEAERYLNIIREIRKSYKMYDMHLHPFDIVSNRLKYTENKQRPGLFSLGEMEYSKPNLEGIKTQLEKENSAVFDKAASKLGQFFIQKVFYHTGPYVFGALFEFCGLHKGLLLPVAPPDGLVESQMDAMFQMYSQDDRFLLGGTIPNMIQNEEAKSYLEKQVVRYGIAAVKIHPCITGIDLNDSDGRRRVECIIEACEELNLPVIIHTGGNNAFFGSAGNYASIDNFTSITLKASVPVVLAHGGVYGESSSGYLYRAISVLYDLLLKNENIYIDISALRRNVICHLLKRIEVKSILFGSDGLYENPLIMQMRLLSALEETHSDPETAFIEITNENCRKTIFY